MSQNKKNKLNIQGLNINLKEGFLTIDHTPSTVTASGVMLGKTVTEEGNKQVNQGMLDCLQLFVPHFCMIIEVPGFKNFTKDYIENEEAATDEKLKGFYVTGFSISAKGGVTIKGGIKTATGRVTSMNAPLTSIDPEASNYEFAGDLQRLINIANLKAEEYFIDGNFGVDLFNQPKDESKAEAQHQD